MKTNRNTLNRLFIFAGIALATTACSRDADPIPTVPPSDGTEMRLNGGVGGSSAANTVFVDLSAARQDSAKRESWDLAFYNGDDYRVQLNNTKGASAVMVNKTDINTVSAADIHLDDLAIALGTPGAFDNIDDLTGDLSQSLIPAISTTDENNKVFVVNPIGGSHGATIDPDNLYKIRILRSGDDYVLQYAKLNATTYESQTISKDEAFHFQYFSFTEGTVTVAPPKTDWDFRWTWSLHTGMMPNGDTFPYGYPDLILINHLSGVRAAEVVFSDESGNPNGKPDYASFTATHISDITFSDQEDVIGSNWRKTTGSPLGAQADRYYIIQDVDGNIYKLRFISMGAGADTGTRGYPELEYQLVKQG